MTRRANIVVTVIALAFAGLHAWNLPRTLEDEDSVNFALGVENFSIANHQPHPPGYPVYIALGKVSNAVLTRIRPGWDRDRRAASGLALWSLIAGTAGIWALWWFWSGLGLPPLVALSATAASAAAPLYWFTAGRPLSDTPGLVSALAVQAAFLHGFRAQPESPDTVPRLWWWAAAGAGLAIGIRSQTMWLTLPLLGFACVHLVRHRQWRAPLALIACSLAGAALWALPLLWLTGGPSAYIEALSSQAAQDFSGVKMLALTPSWTQLQEELTLTFAEPWRGVGWPFVVLGLAALGTIRLVWRRSETGLILALAYGPYLMFHLLFQEVETLRYALPFATLTAGLAVVGVAIAGGRVAMAATAAGVVACVVSVQPILHEYADGAPVFRGLREIRHAWKTESSPPVLSAHHDPWWGTARAIDWYRGTWDAMPPSFPGNRESLRLVRHFLNAPPRPVWFLADPKRHDLARFDPRTTIHRGTWLLPPGSETLIGGRRHYEFSWWTIDPPFWMLGTGWSLTPELDALSVADDRTPLREPAEAFVRRGAGPARLMVGFRHQADQSARIALTLDGRPIHTWVTAPQAAGVEWIELPQGIPDGDGMYATLRFSVVGGDVRFEQFDAAPATEVMFALAGGWSPLEKERQTGQLLRWTTQESTIEIRNVGKPVRLELNGESPLADFANPPRVLIWSGSRLLRRLAPESAFSVEIPLLPEDLASVDNRVTISVDLARTPAERAAGRERRNHGLRLTRVAVVPSR